MLILAHRRILLRHTLRHAIRPSFRSSASRSQPPIIPPPTPSSPPLPTASPAVPFWHRLGPLTRAANLYSRAQSRRPYLTQLVSALVIYLAADVSAQAISGRAYEPARSVRTLLIGSLVAIPHYRWVLWLSRNFNYSSRVLSIGARILVNQTVMPPLFNCYFFGAQALLSGETWDAAVDRVKRTVPVSLVNSWKFWPAVMALSFAFVPMEHRAVFSNLFAIFWQTYLSYLNRLAETKQRLVAEQAADAAHALQGNQQLAPAV